MPSRRRPPSSERRSRRLSRSARRRGTRPRPSPRRRQGPPAPPPGRFRFSPPVQGRIPLWLPLGLLGAGLALLQHACP